MFNRAYLKWNSGKVLFFYFQLLVGLFPEVQLQRRASRSRPENLQHSEGGRNQRTDGQTRCSSFHQVWNWLECMVAKLCIRLLAGKSNIFSYLLWSSSNYFCPYCPRKSKSNYVCAKLKFLHFGSCFILCAKGLQFLYLKSCPYNNR